MSTPSLLQQLSNIISQGVENINNHFTQHNLQYPAMDLPFNPASLAEEQSLNPSVIPSAMQIVSACAQLSALVNIPSLTLFDAVGGFHISSALRVALEANVIEILRGQSQGLHVSDIAAKNGMEPVRLARVLRLLATHHIFIETSPDTFKNNRLSSMMDTLKSFEEIQANTTEKHVGTPGVAALLEHTADEVMKSSAFLTEVLLDKKAGHSDAAEDTALAYAFKTKKGVFDWYEEPGNEYRLKRFAAAMEGAAKLDPPNAIFSGFDWGSLPEGSTIVDVGGGLGHAVLQIFMKYPKLKYIVQDRSKVIQEAEGFWKTRAPDALKSGSVVLQEHDFYTPQKAKNPAVFMCSMIFHDHGKQLAQKILNHLHATASMNTKLVIIDQVVPYACPSSTTEGITKGIIGAAQLPSPPPLLPNLGKANAIAYIGDFQMFSTNGGEERTLGSFIDLLTSTGWKITEVHTIPGSIHKQVIAVPM